MKNQKGFTLAEVCVAALLLAIGATGIFAVVLTCRYTTKNNQVREEMHHYARKVTEDLRGYVRTVENTTLVNAPGSNWIFPGDSSTSPCRDWALEACDHNVDALLPAHLRAAPFNGTMTYTVSTPNGLDGARQIDVKLHWNDSE